MDEKIKLLISTLGENRIKENENLKYHTYNKLDVFCEYFYITTSQKELIDILTACLELKIPYSLFSNGTKLIIKKSSVKGLTIKNRSGIIKIGGIKGKVSPTGIGIEEALVEVDSGVSLGKLKEYLAEQKLQNLLHDSSSHSSIGGALFIDERLKQACQKVTVWRKGEKRDFDPYSLEKDMVILSAVFRAKAV